MGGEGRRPCGTRPRRWATRHARARAQRLRRNGGAAAAAHPFDDVLDGEAHLAGKLGAEDVEHEGQLRARVRDRAQELWRRGRHGEVVCVRLRVRLKRVEVVGKIF